jgi:hypothetical protein
VRLDRDRFDIKWPLIEESNLIPAEYDALLHPNPAKYSCDSADLMILRVAQKLLKQKEKGKKRKRRKYVTMRYMLYMVYFCKTYSEAAKTLLKEVRNGYGKTQSGPYQLDTVKRYIREAKKIVNEYIYSNLETKNTIISLIKDEFAEAKQRDPG